MRAVAGRRPQSGRGRGSGGEPGRRRRGVRCTSWSACSTPRTRRVSSAPLAPLAGSVHTVPVPDEPASRDPVEAAEEARQLGVAATPAPTLRARSMRSRPPSRARARPGVRFALPCRARAARERLTSVSERVAAPTGDGRTVPEVGHHSWRAHLLAAINHSTDQLPPNQWFRRSRGNSCAAAPPPGGSQVTGGQVPLARVVGGVLPGSIRQMRTTETAAL